MAKKDITIIAGDSYDLGFRVSGRSGPIALDVPGTRLVAHVTDASGTRVVAPFSINVTNPSGGEFVITLPPSVTRQLRGKYGWFARYEGQGRVITLSSGSLVVRSIVQ